MHIFALCVISCSSENVSFVLCSVVQTIQNEIPQISHPMFIPIPSIPFGYVKIASYIGTVEE